MSKLLLFIPAYNCAPQIPRVLAQFQPEWKDLFQEILVVDNRSPDNTLQAAQDAAPALAAKGYNITIIQNDENVNLGGTHKVAFKYAIDKGFDYVAIIHGDDQGSIADLVPHLQTGEHKNYDYFMGSRFARGSKLIGYSFIRTIGNYVFNLLFSLVAGRWLTDLGSGLNVFKVQALKGDRYYINFPNRLTFNFYFTIYMCAFKKNFAYFPLTWREDDQVSNARLFKILKELLQILGRYTLKGKKLITSLPTPSGIYTYKVIAKHPS